MFTLQLSPTYFAEVTLRVPVDAGKVTTFTFDAELRRLTQAEHDALMERARRDNLSDSEVARVLMVGWRKVRGADSAELPFTPESLGQLLQVAGAGTAICRAYLDSVGQAAAKNS